MSRFIAKNINKTPVRSPSPDIVNRNIIGRTASPINEAMTKLRISKSSKSPLGRGFLNNEEYEAYIKGLQEKIRLLTSDNEILLAQNAHISKQIDFLKQINLKHRKEIYKKSEPQLQYQPINLSQYEVRIANMNKELKRIQELFTIEIHKNERLESENDDLRERIQGQGKSSRSADIKLKKQLVNIEYSLTESFDRLAANYQRQVESVLEEKLQRLNRIEKDQTVILKMIENGKYRSPAQPNKSQVNQFSTSYRTPSVEEKGRYSPSSEDRTYQRERGFNRQIQCEQCKIYLRRIAELQAQINTKRDIPTRRSKIVAQPNVSASHLEDYLQKLEEIKMILNNQQIEDSINYIEEHLSNISTIEEKFQFMKEQKNIIIQELKQKEIQFSLQIASLQKEKEVLKMEVKEQSTEIEKLKELLNSAIKSRLANEEKQSLPKKKPSSQGSILRRYIEQAIGKIQNLEDQIENTLKQ